MHYCFLTLADLSNPGFIRARELGRALIDAGVEVTYIVDDTPCNRAYTRLHPRARVEMIRDPAGPSQLTRRRSLLRRLRPDYVDLFMPSPKTLIPLAGLSWAKVIALWDEPRIMNPFYATGTRGLLARTLNRWLLARAWLPLAATPYIRDEFARRFGVNMPLLPYGAYLPDMPSSPSPYTAPTAAYMGAFYPNWDHAVVYHAAALLRRSGKAPPIVHIGGGGTAEDRRQWADFLVSEKLKNVRQLGHLSDEQMLNHLRHARVLLFPIRDNELNRARCTSKPLAYAAARRPVITCRVGVVPHYLGEQAIYVPCTPEAFADALDRMMSGPDLPDVEYGLENHSWAARARELLELIRQRESHRPI